MNVSRYVGNNATGGIDPSGLVDPNSGTLVVYDADDGGKWPDLATAKAQQANSALNGTPLSGELATGDEFLAMAKKLQAEHGYAIAPMNGPIKLLEQVKEQYEKNGNTKIYLWAIDHGTKKGGQQIDKAYIPKDILPIYWAEFQPYVAGVIFVGCNVGQDDEACAAISKALQGCVHACNETVYYEKGGGVKNPDPLKSKPWLTWNWIDGKVVFDGRPVDKKK